MSAFHFGLPINRKELITITNSIGNQRELNTTLQTVPPNLYTEPEPVTRLPPCWLLLEMTVNETVMRITLQNCRGV